MARLTDKMEVFCKEYIIDLNATQAAIRAGYSKKTAKEIGAENLSKPIIQERISELKAGREERLQIDADWVLSQAVKVHLRCMQAEPVMLKGEQVEDDEGRLVYKFDSSGANKALELVGKHINIQAFKENATIELGSSITPWGSLEAGTDE